MVRLIDDLLDVSRINRSKMELRRARILLADALSSAVETARPAIEAAGHQLTTDLPAELITLDADLTRLAQVFSKLNANSAKYTEPGGRIALAARRDGAEVVVIPLRGRHPSEFGRCATGFAVSGLPIARDQRLITKFLTAAMQSGRVDPRTGNEAKRTVGG